MTNKPDEKKYAAVLESVFWRDEILSVMFWMTGEGIGQAFALTDLKRFLNAEDEILIENIELMVSNGLVQRCAEDRFALTEVGRVEGGRRFADSFDSMIKPGHFECDEPDCDCHSPDSLGEPCRNFIGAGPHPG